MSIRPYVFSPGSVPLLVSIPHAGTEVPVYLTSRLSQPAHALPDTDWHVDKLYDFLGDLGASVIAATRSRYVVDLNRPSTDESLYPGQTTTGLFPQETFLGDAVWSAPPHEDEKNRIIAEIWKPYHDRIRMELDRLVAEHGFACLWEAHSIAPVLPRLFEGALPDLNLGTNDGAACPDEIAQGMLDVVEADGRYSAVLNGRFKGGYITRHFGQPQNRILAFQLEIAQSAYMADGSWYGEGGIVAPPPRLDFEKAETLRPLLRRMMQTYLSAAADHLETQA
ncbi:N-formylglutamate deformylase [Indioceanicola profundi]|uniref:N-formylglutamate deformylase n=1 Tax=Indioceanicola profundi TaxID=2220096 RepID=UPI000E6ACB00|nr:N-formylglutamate deformylase [Indioceanicola profundi]